MSTDNNNLTFTIQQSVRQESLTCIGRIYSLAYPEMYLIPSYNRSCGLNFDSLVKITCPPQRNILPGYRSRFASQSIALRRSSKIISMSFTVTLLNRNIRTLALQIISDYILPLPPKGDDEEVAWTSRLLTVLRGLEEKGLNTIMAVSNLKVP